MLSFVFYKTCDLIKGMNNSILITGGNGFLGKAFAISALAAGFKVRVSARRKTKELNYFPDFSLISNIDSATDWSSTLSGVNTVVHCAASVHIKNDKDLDSLKSFRKVNVDGTLNLAHQAVLAGVSRFIFISSIKVNGESTILEHPFHADSYPNPQDPYGISKMEAEQGLQKIASQSNMEVVIIRPPLVYGPEVKANFLTMMNWLNKGIPIPLGAITKNRRSFVFLDNLISLIFTCINHPAAANQIFLVSDDEDLSTAGLLAHMAKALGKPSKLIAIPVFVITIGSKLIGKSNISQRLCGSLQVDIKKTKELLGWAPPVSVDEGLRQTAAHFLKVQSRNISS